jgi:hypothetical protein
MLVDVGHLRSAKESRKLDDVVASSFTIHIDSLQRYRSPDEDHALIFPSCHTVVAFACTMPCRAFEPRVARVDGGRRCSNQIGFSWGHVMPVPQTPEPHLPLLLQHPPVCPACFRDMQFVGIGLHARFRRLAVRHFACDCGERISEVVARLD